MCILKVWLYRYSSSEDENRNKEFPEWTRSDNLNQAWRDQERLNPSTIFGPTQPVRMVDLFNTGHPRFSKRTSSVKSSGTDMVGITVEENEYAHRMGYTN
ncbi:hypothetical protein BDV93DRAFT_455294 [Ceratobasidium sp. AG-I]|nr:hypothetical protein BDV93DRAFT_455294 [Ceratobasidium sp. AG-I]